MIGCIFIYNKFKTTHTMSNTTKKYRTPQLRCVRVILERGFAISAEGGFEQPEFGGEDNI